jgi:hypothetical protein
VAAVMVERNEKRNCCVVGLKNVHIRERSAGQDGGSEKGVRCDACLVFLLLWISVSVRKSG